MQSGRSSITTQEILWELPSWTGQVSKGGPIVTFSGTLFVSAMSNVEEVLTDPSLQFRTFAVKFCQPTQITIFIFHTIGPNDVRTLRSVTRYTWQTHRKSILTTSDLSHQLQLQWWLRSGRRRCRVLPTSSPKYWLRLCSWRPLRCSVQRYSRAEQLCWRLQRCKYCLLPRYRLIETEPDMFQGEYEIVLPIGLTISDYINNISQNCTTGNQFKGQQFDEANFNVIITAGQGSGSFGPSPDPIEWTRSSAVKNL